MKHKISLILLISLSFSLFSFYSINNIKNKINWFPKFRNLDGATDVQIKELCEKGDEKLFKYYYEEGSYDVSFEANSEDSKILINLIKDQSTEDIKEYIKKCAKWLVFIIFGILAIIGWIICCACCCCNCCCFKNCCTNKIVQFVIFVLCAACYGCVAILGIYTAASANNAIKGLNNTSCSLLNFIDDIISGQKRHTIPYWRGIEGIKEILQSIKEGINNTIYQNKDNFYDATNDYNTSLNNANSKLQELSASDVLNSSNKFYSIDFPDTSGEYLNKKMVPFCISGWDKFMESFESEYNNLKDSTSPVITNMKNTFNEVTGCNNICGESQTLTAITESIDAIDDISGSFKDIQDQITDPWYDLQSTINDIGEKSLKIAGSVICVFCASVCVLILLYKLLNCIGKVFKIIIHVLWNIVALTTIASFIIGGVIGLLGKIGTDLVSVMNYIISEENLNSPTPEVIENIGNKDYLIECLHGDGNLSSVLELESRASGIADLNDIKRQLINLEGLFGDKTESITPTIYDNLLTGNYYSNEFFILDDSGNPTTNQYKIDTELNDVNEKLNQCTYKEYWGNDTSNTNGFNPTNNYGITAVANTFINIYDIADINYASRYSQCDSSTQQIVNKVGDRLNNIRDFFKSNSDLENLKTKEKAVKTQMDGIYTNLNKAINSSLTIISSITDQLNKNVGADGELWGMINCKFMGDGIKVVFKNLHDGLGKRFVNLGNTLVAMAFLESFAIVFTLLTLKNSKPNSNSNSNSKSK